MLSLAAAAGLVAGAAPAAAQTPAAATTRELVDEFQVNCLANLGDLNLVRTGAEMLRYESVPPGLLAQLNAEEAWFLPSEHGQLVLGLSARGGCGVIARPADAATAAALLGQRLRLEPMVAEPAADRQPFEYRLTHGGYVAVLLVVGGDGDGAVAVSVLAGRRVGPAPPTAQPTRRPAPAAPAPASAVPPPAASVPPPVAAVAPAPAPPRAARWDPQADIVENLAVDLFDDLCHRTRNDRQAIERQAETLAWTPIDSEATHRSGFERGWVMRSPAGETVMVFFDPLQPKCCISAFPVRRNFVAAAVGTRYGLQEPRTQRAGAKDVLVFRPRDRFQITIDFEEVDDRGTFGSVCYTQQ
jgi:hypothetical protein